MRQLSQRERMLVLFAALALIGFILVFVIGLPMRNRSLSLARDVDNLRHEIAQAKSLYAQMPEIQTEIQELRARAAGLMLEKSNVKVEVVHEIDRLTSDLGMSVTGVTPPGDAEPVSGCLKYTASFRADSSFSEIVRLLYKLEQPSRRLWVEGIEITPGRKGGEALHVDVHVAVYVPAPESEEQDAEA